MIKNRAPYAAVLLVPALALAGCAAPASGTDEQPGVVQVVASTSVYGDIVQTIAGDAAEVTSIISDIAQDPHEYEATSRDALALSRADLVVMNGGGYDAFMTTLLDAQDGEPTVIDAVELAGLHDQAHEHDHGHAEDHERAEGDDHGQPDHTDEDHADEEHADEEHADEHADEHGHEGHSHGAFNEHVWYDLHVMHDLAESIAHALGDLDAANAATYTANAAAFIERLGEIDERAHALADAHAGLDVAVTEPVALYLLEMAGLHDVTPAEFTRAIESGADAPVLVLEEVVGLVSDSSVAFLAYNEQTVGPQTERVLAAATAAGLPVVSFSELLPEGLDYLEWMSANVDAIAEAIG